MCTVRVLGYCPSQYLLASPTALTQRTCIQYERLLCERRHQRGYAHDRGIERSGADVRCSVGKWVPLKWVEIVAI